MPTSNESSYVWEPVSPLCSSSPVVRDNLTQLCEELFGRIPRPEFEHIGDALGFWRWLGGTLVANGALDAGLGVGIEDTMAEESIRRIGKVQLRTLRVKPVAFSSVASDIDPLYQLSNKKPITLSRRLSGESEDKTPFWTLDIPVEAAERVGFNRTLPYLPEAFEQRYTGRKMGSTTYPGPDTPITIHGGGYTLELDDALWDDPLRVQELVLRLASGGFVDRFTRVVFLEVLIANLNLEPPIWNFLSLRVEFHPSGGIFPEKLAVRSFLPQPSKLQLNSRMPAMLPFVFETWFGLLLASVLLYTVSLLVPHHMVHPVHY